MIILFLLFIFYNNLRSETKHIRNNIFLEMKNYSLSLDDERFDIDIVSKAKDKEKQQKFIPCMKMGRASIF